ncbi:hypothetical protein B0H11DRAFT_481994 [Mycena galericulata]|nr:hypothetical protein B0H11DRAFT_481994 [Mycena galericulata]
MRRARFPMRSPPPRSPPPRLVPKWGESSRLAQETIERHVQAHEQHNSERVQEISNHVPRLVDLVIDRLAMEDEQTIRDVMDKIPSVILANNLQRWHRIPYPVLRHALLRLLYDRAEEGSEWDQLACDLHNNIDEWILSNERWLRDADLPQWHLGLVTLNDAELLFPDYVLNLKQSRRMITRPGHLPGEELLCGKRRPQIAIQPSTAAFKKTFNRISNGLLRNLDWNNLLVAGGIVLAALTLKDPPKSDIDMYIYGLPPADATRKIHHIFDTFRSNLPSGSRTLVVRNSKTITFYSKYPLRRVQIILKLVKSPRDVLLNFDLDICAMGWDGSNVWMLPRAARALETGCNVFTMDLIHGHYLSKRRASHPQRIFKYADRGFGIRFLPSYISSLDRSLATIEKDFSAVGDAPLPLDLSLLMTNARIWTEDRLMEIFGSFSVATSPKILGGRCLTGFSAFMRHVALWELSHCGYLTLDNDWGEGKFDSYEERPVGSLTPEYPWNAAFTLIGYRSHIDQTNLDDVKKWIRSDELERLQRHGVYFGYELSDLVQRVAYAPTLDLLLQRDNDLCLPVILPPDFAVYANDLVSRAQASAGLKETKILKVAIPEHNLVGLPAGAVEGLFIWRIGPEMMWQQLDRRIDEVFEALLVFRRVNSDLNEDLQAQRLIREFSRRQVRREEGNEFHAFAQWVGRPPLEPLRRGTNWADPADM